MNAPGCCASCMLCVCAVNGLSPPSSEGTSDINVHELSACMQLVREDGMGALSASSGASAECALSAGGSDASPRAWSPCSSNASYADLKDGDYTFTARALGASANAAPQTAVSNFTVDTSVPAVQVWHQGPLLSPLPAPGLCKSCSPLRLTTAMQVFDCLPMNCERCDTLVQITSAPPAICSTAATRVAFNSSKTDSTFVCQLNGTSAGGHIPAVLSLAYKGCRCEFPLMRHIL